MTYFASFRLCGNTYPMTMRAILFLITMLSYLKVASQDDVLSITPESFENSQFTLDDLDAWIWKSGHDPSWASDTINTDQWERVNPQNLTIEYADDHGRVEGWFRLKVRFDSSLRNEQLYFKKWSRDACEVFINGELVVDYGEIHPDKKKTRTFSNSGLLPQAVDFDEGINTIAIHVVDYTAMYPARLRSRLAGSIPFLAIVNQKYYDNRAAYWQRNPIYKSIWFTVCTLLVPLFWFLVYRNPRERNLKLVAICSSLLLLVLILFSLNDVKGLSIGEYRFAMSSFFFSLFCTLAFIPLMVSLIFTDRIERWIRITALGIVLFGALNVLVLYHILPMGICILTCFAICIYLVLHHRKELRGAQWAIVGGILSTIGFLVGLFSMLTLAQSDAPSMASKLDVVTTGVFLSFPLAMLVYVAMRFQEMIKDVKLKAEKLIQVGQEKATILANQNTRLEQEVKARTRDLEASMEHLKSTQDQLIHSEKMASLGELTAGIAHEIQNPLNFVNNFADVSGELIDEAKEEIEKGDLIETKNILDDLSQNLQKISHHGSRASNIVNGMLAHSRTSTGKIIETDINTLCNEYLRLSYHGLRAKDKTFNAEMDTNLQEGLPAANIVPQEIGRVLLNLLNNAFYAVHKKKLTAADKEYMPRVGVSTKRENEYVVIRVQDNGLGMPPEIVGKIFQPFFTTKPAGEGTGLGLSLSYDIVTKGHGGTLEAESEEGIGSKFVIKIPIV